MKSNLITLLALISAVIVIINNASFNLELGISYYLVLIGVFAILLILSKNVKFHKLTIILIISVAASLVFNNVPNIFMPYERFAAFILILGLISPSIQSSTLNNFRIKTFLIINVLIVLFVISSFLGWVTGLYTGMEGRRDFTGLFNHSMILGPMAGITFIIGLYLYHKTSNKILKLMSLSIIMISFLTNIIAGSRIALLSTLAGSLFFLYKINQKKLSGVIKFTLVVGTLLILTFPIWQNYTDFLMAKSSDIRKTSDLFISRSDLWYVRILEFSNSPIFGIGFSTIDETLDLRFGKKNFNIEPGSSYLGILSMSGILGFIPFIILVFGYLFYLFKNNQKKIILAFLIALLSFFLIHMIAEGYIFSAGSGLFFYFWLLLGNIEILKRRILNDTKISKVSQ